MGWKSDWLYLLIISKVESLWKDTRSQLVKGYVPPESFLIREFENADWVNIFPRPPIKREWHYMGESFDRISTGEVAPTFHGAYTDDTKRFFKVGHIGFNVSQDRKYVMFVFQIGPRYGRLQYFRVKYQGKHGLLQRTGGFPEWIS
jgi:hypothetical protein